MRAGGKNVLPIKKGIYTEKRRKERRRGKKLQWRHILGLLASPKERDKIPQYEGILLK